MFGVDLVKLGVELERKGQNLRLVKQIKLATSVASAHQDLRSASDALDLLKKRTTEKRAASELSLAVAGAAEPEEGIIAGALLAHAAILYARATDTKPIDRLKWFGRTMLTVGERVWHDDVMHLRNNALAHFGVGAGLAEGSLIDHALVLMIPKNCDQIEINYIEHRASTRADLSAKLTLLVHKLLPVAHQKYRDRLRPLFEMFKDEVIPDKSLNESVRACLFDPQSLRIPSMTDFDFKDGEQSSHYFVRRPPKPNPGDRS